MTPEEKIEALREWVRSNDEPDFGQFAAGYLKALTEVRDIIDPPKWRQMVNEEAEKSLIGTPIGAVLYHLSHVANPNEYDAAFELANIIAVCEAQVGDGWQADPDSTAYGCAEQDEYDVFHLLDPLANLTEPLCWKRVGDRSAAWLRSLKDEKLGTRTDAKYEHTLEPHCPVCFGVCAGSNRDGAA